MKRSQLGTSELERSYTAPCKVRRLSQPTNLLNLPDDVLITVLKDVTGEKFDFRKLYRLNYKSINGMTSPQLFPVIPAVRQTVCLNTCRALTKFGHQLFEVVAVDGIPLLQQSCAKPQVKNPAFPIYLSYCVQKFHSTIQILRLPFIASPYQFSNILRNKKYTFPCLRELRFTHHCATECILADDILAEEVTSSTSLCTLDVSSPCEDMLCQLYFSFPALETLTLRDIKYSSLHILFVCLEHRSQSYPPLKYLSISLEDPIKAGLTSIDSKLMQAKCLAQFMKNIKAKAKAVFKYLGYFHLSAVGNENLLMQLTRDDAKVGPESSFAPVTVVDFDILYSRLTRIYRDGFCLGQKVIDIAHLAKNWRATSHWSRGIGIGIGIPRELKYSTTIQLSSYDDVLQLMRSPRMVSILGTISNLDLPHLRTLSLPFCINSPGTSPASSIRDVISAITTVLTQVSGISQLEVSSEALESGRILDPHFSAFTDSLVNLKAIHFKRPDQLRKRASRQGEDTFERNRLLITRLPDFLKGVQHCSRLEEIEIEVTIKDRGKPIPTKELSKLNMSLNLLKGMEKEMCDTDFSSIRRLIRDW